MTLAAIGHIQGVTGQRQRAQETLAHLKALSRSRYVTAYGVALVYAGLGDRERAFEWLDKGIQERTHGLVWLKLDPRWEGLRRDPRLAHSPLRVLGARVAGAAASRHGQSSVGGDPGGIRTRVSGPPRAFSAATGSSAMFSQLGDAGD